MNALLSETRPPVSRESQERWAHKTVSERLQFVRKLRQAIAANAENLAQAAALVSDRPLAEKLVSEVLPLAEACRWLEINASQVLSSRFHGKKGRPFWLRGVTFEVQRQPFGTVLVIGPGNYPLFLPAVHTLQALVAGNAVWLKPAPETRHVALAFAGLAFDSGLDPALLTILGEDIVAGQNAIADGVDKVIFTGSSENGRSVLSALAETNTPSVMELSGEDAVVVLADADLDLVVRALRFGRRLNDGETCMAPARIIVVESVSAQLASKLGTTNFIRVATDFAAVAEVNRSEFALGASIFSASISRAKTLASQIKTGFVVINDLIVPTADPRMPFGGTRASGFGSTRGAEGLLEMTFPHAVAIRSGRSHPHFDEPIPEDAALFAAYIQLAHGLKKFDGLLKILRAIRQKIKSRKTSP